MFAREPSIVAYVLAAMDFVVCLVASVHVLLFKRDTRAALVDNKLSAKYLEAVRRHLHQQGARIILIPILPGCRREVGVPAA